MTTTVVGAYGFRLSGLDAPGWLGVRDAPHWPELSCRRESRRGGPELTLDIGAGELRVRADIPHSELVHPLLGRVAAVMALAHGADAMHAGAVVGSDGAWAVIGPKGGGKSTLLAALADVGMPIVADDVLVFSEGTAMAGPRCIDLRPDAKHLGLGVAVRPNDPRHRISLPPIAAEHPLAGVIHLDWSGEHTKIEPVNPREAIRRLLILRGDKGYPRNPRALLDLATLPTVLLRRPRSASLDASVADVQRLLCDGAVGTRGVAPRHQPRLRVRARG
jgi:hypothetical protein